MLHFRSSAATVCASLALLWPASALAARNAAPQAGKIQHVVIVVQENRSFDDLFQGFPGADTVSVGQGSGGVPIALQPITLEAGYDIDHTSGAFFTAYDNGKMDGFNLESTQGGTNSQYGYVPRNEVQPYFDMASAYVLADRMFTSHLDASFISHQYIIAGQANHSVNLPSSVWGCDGGPSDTIGTLTDTRQYGPNQPVCQDYNTLGDELNTAKRSWRFYAQPLNGDSGDIWSAYQVIRHIRYTNQWTIHVKSPSSQFLTDVGNGYLATVTWVTPSRADSDHPDAGSNTGPSWVTSVINAVGQSKFWDSTAIFLMWDDWGGWYEHVPPPQLDFDGLGFRVPLVMISPYAKRGYVTHVQYEHGSILRFVEDTFGLPRLARSDTRANDPASDAFDFSKPPRPFTPFTAPYPRRHFLEERPTGEAPDAE